MKLILLVHMLYIPSLYLKDYINERFHLQKYRDSRTYESEDTGWGGSLTENIIFGKVEHHRKSQLKSCSLYKVKHHCNL
jgi:hypothetical protein